MPDPAIVWFRRDLRLTDLPALLAARDRSTRALAVFVLDDALLRPAGSPRIAFLAGCLRALDADLGGRLLLLHGDPVEVIPQLAHSINADSVHVSADFGPYGTQRDDAVQASLAAAGVPLIRTGSPYAVTPGRISTKAGTPYKVFTSYRRGWLDHGWRSPAATTADSLAWLDPAELPPLAGALRCSALGALPGIGDERDGPALPPPGEAAALRRWRTFRDERLTGYDTHRDRPDRDATTRLSPHLKFGCIHPRTVLHDLRESPSSAASVLRSELAWRDFYADVLFHRPDTARRNYNPRFDAMRYDAGPDAEAAFDSWREGRTGYPIVDAGMRQLLGEGWMHNRVRMITASFLTKDLHLPWWRGARHFMKHLVDGDLASNQHGWQWTAGCGTDAAPYFRVFNPVTQGERFDPDGDYVRRWVPELRHIDGKAVHRPWARGAAAPLFSVNGPVSADMPVSVGTPGYADTSAYPSPIVDHAEERVVALARFGEIR
ncbi:cryptochrome/photolyase family protein [Tomitella cavernea]|uniref:Deoxyribodipyrimidine photo-lyase n=1 Tax=Tomitella cavernea TaxID=1387982 RepID=A0ABP9CW53_9ACTN|nr:deoxyribodipyrimidine photo-lyase [Tomitella cavernea]